MPAPSRILDHARPTTYLNKVQRLDPRQNQFTGIPWENWANAALVDPKITALSPATLPATASATTITVTGTGFGSGSIVEVNGVALVTTFVSTTSLTAPYDPSVEGTMNFTVRNVSGMESNDFPFVVTATELLSVPNMNWLKDDILAWLVEKGVAISADAISHFTKTELLLIVDAYQTDGVEAAQTAAGV